MQFCCYQLTIIYLTIFYLLDIQLFWESFFEAIFILKFVCFVHHSLFEVPGSGIKKIFFFFRLLMCIANCSQESLHH